METRARIFFGLSFLIIAVSREKEGGNYGLTSVYGVKR